MPVLVLHEIREAGVSATVHIIRLTHPDDSAAIKRMDLTLRTHPDIDGEFIRVKKWDCLEASRRLHDRICEESRRPMRKARKVWR